MKIAERLQKKVESQRRNQILEAALTTFLRFGFRKTSMDNVAHSAQLSRQALYLYFANKEELFCAALEHALTSALHDVAAHLEQGGASLQTRLLAALDAWVGRYLDVLGEDLADLHEASARLGGSVLRDSDSEFVKALTQEIRQHGLPASYKAAGVTARQLAETLYAIARGLKHDVKSRREFGERLKAAVRVVCLPFEAP